MYGSLTVVNSTFFNNTAQGGASEGSFGGDGYGGAIFNLDGAVSLTFATIADNTVNGGAGRRMALVARPMAARSTIWPMATTSTRAGPSRPR